MQEKRACQSSATCAAASIAIGSGRTSAFKPVAQAVRRSAAWRCRHARSSPARGRPASVRPAPWTVTGSPVMRQIAAFDRALDRRPIVLPLPAHERPAVIFERQPPAGHGRIGAGRDGEAAQQIVRASSAPRPARWTSERPDRAFAAGDGQAIVEHLARVARCLGEFGVEQLDRARHRPRTRRRGRGERQHLAQRPRRAGRVQSIRASSLPTLAA